MMLEQSTAEAEANSLARIKGDGFTATVFLSALNQRIQVLEYEAENAHSLVASLEERACDAGFGKVFLKAPVYDKTGLEDAGMSVEATITGYFAGQPAAVMSLFLSDQRRQRPSLELQDSIMEMIRKRPANPSVPPLPEGYRLLPAQPADADELAKLYRDVFDSYPFPINDPEYLVSTMENGVVYRIVRDERGALVAAASAETQPGLRNAEMTDFATLPDQRGLGLAQHILAALEEDMVDRGIPNLYTIARARSAGMSRVFYNRGYELTGTLVNNCHIAGRFEDMHVWCKSMIDGLDLR
jgi:putative beta-lysine N-acetyltransferase